MSQLISEYEIPTKKPFLSCLCATIGQMKMLDELLSKVPCSSKILLCCVSSLQTIVFKWQHEWCVCTPELGYWRKDLVMRFGICPTARLRKKHSSVRGWGGGASLPQEQTGITYHKITSGGSLHFVSQTLKTKPVSSPAGNPATEPSTCQVLEAQ